MKRFLSFFVMMCFVAISVAQAQDKNDIKVYVTDMSGIQFSNNQMMRAGEWLTYVEDGVTPEGLIGIGMPFYWGYMFPSSILGAYAGTQITQVAYVDPGEMQFAGTYEFHIYLGGDDAPGTEVVTQSIQVSGMSGDIEVVKLDTPVKIDGKENVWVCMYQDGSVQYPAIFMTDTGEPNARWIGVDGYGWMDMANVQGGEGMAWILWAYAEDIDAIGEFESNVAIYPNPTSGNLSVAAPGMNHLTVLNSIGQVVYDTSVSGDGASLDMAQYPAGVYMVRVEAANGVSVKRVTVK